MFGMTYDPEKHHRRSIRLKGYDYTQAGAYFVTVCVQNHECLFGQILDNNMRLNHAGVIVQTVWNELPVHYTHVQLDQFVAMPNHVHGIVILTDVGAGFKPVPTRRHGLQEIIRAFKTFSSRRINQLRGIPGIPVWQRNYYEHIIRHEPELNRIREYIQTNPLRWELDRENPQRTGADEFESWIYPNGISKNP